MVDPTGVSPRRIFFTLPPHLVGAGILDCPFLRCAGAGPDGSLRAEFSAPAIFRSAKCEPDSRHQNCCNSKGTGRERLRRESTRREFRQGEYFSPCHRLASGRCSSVKMRTRIRANTVKRKWVRLPSRERVRSRVHQKRIAPQMRCYPFLVDPTGVEPVSENLLI